jgi:hypothetical protein
VGRVEVITVLSRLQNENKYDTTTRMKRATHA